MHSGKAGSDRLQTVSGQLLMTFSTQCNALSCSWASCSWSRAQRTDLTDLIILFQIPPICDWAGMFMLKCIQSQSLAQRNSLMQAWSSSCKAAASSFLAPTTLVKLGCQDLVRSVSRLRSLMRQSQADHTLDLSSKGFRDTIAVYPLVLYKSLTCPILCT